MKKRSALIGLLLMLTLIFGSIPAFASGEGGISTYAHVDISTMFDVTIPTSLPVNIGPDGMVSTASDTRIYNNCENNQTVGVCKIDVKALNDWQLLPYHSEATADMEMDTKLASLYININGESAQTTAAGTEETIWSHPAGEIGKMYVGAGSSVPVTYDVEMGQRSGTVENLEVMAVVLTMDYVAPAENAVPYDPDNVGKAAYNDHWITSVNTGDYLYASVPMLNTVDGAHPQGIDPKTSRFRIWYQPYGENRAVSFINEAGARIDNALVDVTDLFNIVNPQDFSFGSPETNVYYQEGRTAGTSPFDGMYMSDTITPGYNGAMMVVQPKSQAEMSSKGASAQVIAGIQEIMRYGTMSEGAMHRLYITCDKAESPSSPVPTFDYSDCTDLEVREKAFPVWYMIDDAIHEIQYVYHSADIPQWPNKRAYKEGYLEFGWSSPVLENGVYKKYVDWQLNKGAAFFFVDCDNTLLGSFFYYAGRDMAFEMSNYVLNNFVHPSLKNKMPSSTSRADNYKGKYSDVPVNGDPWPLTNHLDYYFMENADDPRCSYAYGWAICTVQNFKDIWTTDGTGEGLANVEFFDPHNLPEELMGRGGKIVFLKACYKPGPDLLEDGKYTVTSDYSSCYSEPQKNISTQVYFNKMNTDSTTQGGVMSADYTWERVQFVDGKPYGVKRMRTPFLCTNMELLMWRNFSKDLTEHQEVKVTDFQTTPETRDPDRPLPTITLYKTFPTGLLAMEYLGVNSPDKFDVQTAISNGFRVTSDVRDMYQEAPETRSDTFFIGFGDTRTYWYEHKYNPENEFDGPIFYNEVAGVYYTPRPLSEWTYTFDDQIKQGMRVLGKEALDRHGMIKTANPNYMTNDGEVGTYTYILGMQAFDLPISLSDDYLCKNKFSTAARYIDEHGNDCEYRDANGQYYYDMDAFTNCVWELEDYIIENHPDQSDDTWWTDAYNLFSDGTPYGGTTEDGEESVKYRIPRISYHQLIFYWKEYYNWYFDGISTLEKPYWPDKDMSTKPIPMSAAEADAIALDSCKLSDHAGLCPLAQTPAEVAANVSETLYGEVYDTEMITDEDGKEQLTLMIPSADTTSADEELDQAIKETVENAPFEINAEGIANKEQAAEESPSPETESVELETDPIVEPEPAQEP